jgi:HK97 family phage major capsid protein
MKLKQLIQAEIENKAAITKAKKEGRDLMAIEKPTAEQTARLKAISGELSALDDAADEIAANLKLARQMQDDEKKSGDPNFDTIEIGKHRAEDKPWGPTIAADAPRHVKDEARHMALGTFALAVKTAMSGGQADPRLFAVATGAGTQSDSNLGFAVPMEIAPGIERDMFATGDILSRVDARTVSGNSIAFNVFDETSRADSSRGGGVLGYWVDEGTAPTASNMKLARIEMKLRKVGAFGVMTDELLSDAAALGGELESAFASELTFQVENKIYRGNGASAPLGFLNAACLVSVSKETNQAAATINTTNLSKMWARMPARSQKNAVWLVNVDCQPQIDDLSQAIGTGGTAPRFVNYDATGALTIKGRPVIAVEYAETVGTVGDIALGRSLEVPRDPQGRHRTGVFYARVLHHRRAGVPRLLPRGWTGGAAGGADAVQGLEHAVAVRRSVNPRVTGET